MSDTMSFLPYPDLAALLRACGESGEAAAEIIYSHPKEPEARALFGVSRRRRAGADAAYHLHACSRQCKAPSFR